MTDHPPLLRAPPFPWADATVSVATEAASAPTDLPALFASVRAARIGGRFWADPAGSIPAAATIVRPQALAETRTLHSPDALWVAPVADRNWSRALDAEGLQWRGDVDPWSVLPGARDLIAHGDDEWIALARVNGVAVRILSPGRFGTPEDDDATLDARAAQALVAADWRDPFTGMPSTLAAMIDLLALWRTLLDANREIASACGMAWWKRREIRRFLWHPGRRLPIVYRAHQALAIARRAGGTVAIWPSRVSPALVATARDMGVELVRVEDGFVRSVGLGVDLVPPSSVVADRTGIHFDPQHPSDLETILQTADCAPALLDRARRLREAIVAAGISKYAAGTISTVPDRPPGRRLVLVAGQVEDDMSVLAGGGGLTSNLDLLRRARALEPEAELWFRPHPDVDAGHRKGKVEDADALRHADRIVRGGGMAALLDTVDAVHVLTSLTGFEALLRGREVICHGTPFYAGWGLTRDLGTVPARRTRVLTLDALVAGVLILYPRYLDPVTGLPCPPEILIGRMADAATGNRLGWVAPIRRWQGRLMKALR